MDIKRARRDAVVMGKRVTANLPDTEGMYDEPKKGHGSAASDNNLGWDARASSWSRGADCDYMAIRKEAEENNDKYGVPCGDSFPNPAAGNSSDGPLPNPHNFSSNPGFMGAMGPSDGMNFAPNRAPVSKSSPARVLRRGTQTRGGSTGSVTSVGKNSSAGTPAPGDTNPYAEGGPQIVSSGYNG